MCQNGSSIRSSLNRFSLFRVMLPCLLSLLIASGLYGQTTFSERLDITLDFSPSAAAVLHQEHEDRPSLVIATSAAPSLYLFSVVPDTRDHRLIKAPFAPSDISAFSSGAHGNCLFLWNETSGESAVWFPSTGYQALPVAADQNQYAIADVSNNGHPDLLLFGKGSTGALCYLSSSDYLFSESRALFTDLSISDLSVTDLNGDFIEDVIVADWLSNKIHLFNGIGRSIFAEQVSYSLPGEPGDLSVGTPDSLRRMMVAVTLPEEQEIRVFTVNPLGDFRLDAILSCPARPLDLRVSDINLDGSEEIITATTDGLYVFVRDGREYETILFSSGNTLSGWSLDDVDGDGTPDAILRSTSGNSVSFLANALSTARYPWPGVYAVGAGPHGLAAADFTGDEIPDIAVANSGSSSISFLRNRGNGRLGRQLVVPLRTTPFSVHSAAGLRSTSFVVSHLQSEEVSVVHWKDDVLVSTFSIPTPPDPYILFAEFVENSDYLSFLTRSTGEGGRALSLSLFDQISDDQFIETTLTPSLPDKITAITSYDITGDATRDLVFSTYEKTTSTSTLFVSEALDRFSFDVPLPMYSFSDTLSSIGFIVPGLIDGDTYPDVLLGLDSPGNSLLILLGTPDGVSDSAITIGGVQVTGEESLIIQDLDGDAINDLCLIDAGTKTVVALYGTGDGTFTEKAIICPAAGVSSIEVSSLKEPEVADLLLSHGENGSISVLLNPF